MKRLDILIIISISVIIGLILFIRLEGVTEQTNNILRNQGLIIDITKSVQMVLDRQLNASDEQQSLIDKIKLLETEVKSLKAEIVVLKQEIATLKQELVQSKIIISEQAQNMSSSS